MSNEIVKYHNDFSELPLRKFNSSELDILMAICSKCKYKENQIVSLSFSELRALSSYDARDNKRLAADIRRTNKKLLELNVMLRDEDNPGRTTQFALFAKFITDEKNQTLEVKVNEEFEYILNELDSNFTRFELEEFVRLRSSYAKACYRQLKRYRDTGFWSVSIERFRELMDVPESYKMYNINQTVLTPIEEELSSIFKYFTIEKKYGAGKGTPVVGLEFHFEPERRWKEINDSEDKSKKENLRNNENVVDVEEWVAWKETGHVCPICGKPLVEKVMNGNTAWCHLDGYKKDAPCSMIFNSISEIYGYQETPKRKDHS